VGKSKKRGFRFFSRLSKKFHDAFFRADENTCREIEKDTATRRWLMAFSLSLRRVLRAQIFTKGEFTRYLL